MEKRGGFVVGFHVVRCGDFGLLEEGCFVKGVWPFFEFLLFFFFQKRIELEQVALYGMEWDIFNVFLAPQVKVWMLGVGLFIPFC